MKFTDDYRAKERLWAAHPTVVPTAHSPKLPKFSPKKFSNHAEMNLWKTELLRQLARELPNDG